MKNLYIDADDRELIRIEVKTGSVTMVGYVMPPVVSLELDEGYGATLKTRHAALQLKFEGVEGIDRSFFKFYNEENADVKQIRRA